MSSRVAILVALGLVALLLPRCVDTSALDYVASEAAPDATTSPACVECMTAQQGPCWQAYEPCSVCVDVMQSLIDIGCLTSPVPIDRITCGLPCLDKSGVKAADDPTVLALAQINLCALNSCTAECTAP
jgi:hypothetical protein